MPEEDLSNIREKKKEELKRQMEEAEGKGKGGAEAAQREQREAMKDRMLRKAMTQEARERLGRIRAANEEKAKKVEMLALKLWKSGQIQGKIDDKQLKQLLKRLSSRKEDYNIKRK